MSNRKSQQGTQTSPFGSGKREAHDSSRFYESRLYEGQPEEKKVVYKENSVPDRLLDSIQQASSERMDALPDNSVHLMVTSPPYNVTKEYDEDLSLDEYLALLRRVWAEVYRVLVPGGRACINITNVGRKPYIPLHAFVIQDMLELGFLMRGEIIWNKSASAGSSTAWGSWMSASNPTLRDVHEYILVFCKDTFRRENEENRQNTIEREAFLELTKSVWDFPTTSANKIGHPAPFPVELPARLIELYTFAGEVVLDPFIGSGQTAIAAISKGRHYIGYEIDEGYVRLARERITNLITETGE